MTEDREYHVVCKECGQVFDPQAGTPLWHKARQRDIHGYLDALHITGEECGCIKEKREPDAPYRVFGFDYECHEFDMPFTTFIEAVKEYRDASRDLCTVFISGVSLAVETRLKWL